MSNKTDAKRQLIIDKAAEIFAAKGYREVTMSDVREACEISRGGLYLYYSSVEEIFADVCASEVSEDIDFEGANAAQLLLWFLKEQKKEILRKKNNLSVAKIEYGFACKAQGKDNPIKDSFQTAQKVLEKILVKGNDSGEFACEDPKAAASNMMLAFEGMKAMSGISGITEKRVDSELVYMMRQFMGVEE